MKKLTVKTKRILAAVGGAAIVLALLLFVDSVRGDPLSAALARRAAVRYAEKLYPGQTFTVTGSWYGESFRYVNEVQSGQSVDTRFEVQTRLWFWTDDDLGIGVADHVYRVEERRNTCWRLEQEGEEQLTALARERYGAGFAGLEQSDVRPFALLLCCDVQNETAPGSCTQNMAEWGGALEPDAPFAPAVLKDSHALLTACRVCPDGTVAAAEKKQALRELKAFAEGAGFQAAYYQVRFLRQNEETGALTELAVSDIVPAKEI